MDHRFGLIEGECYMIPDITKYNQEIIILPNENEFSILVRKKGYPTSIDDMYVLNNFDKVSIHSTRLSTPREKEKNIL